MKIEPIIYVDRKTGDKQIEKVPGEKFLKFLYYNPFGKLSCMAMFRNKLLSVIYGNMMDKPSSANKIRDFVSNYDIDMTPFVKDIDEYESFNDFFYRKLKKEIMPQNTNDNELVSMATGKILAFQNINEYQDFYIKGMKLNLTDFFVNEKDREYYRDGTMIIVRLSPRDYHRFHFPCDGEISPSYPVQGMYYSVSPLALRVRPQILYENKREYAYLETKKFGKLVMMEVGAAMVGGIKQTYEPQSSVKKHQEKGYFYFGGSTCIMILPRNVVQIDADILANTSNNLESTINVGERIGVAVDGK